MHGDYLITLTILKSRPSWFLFPLRRTPAYSIVSVLLVALKDILKS